MERRGLQPGARPTLWSGSERPWVKVSVSHMAITQAGSVQWPLMW